MTGFKLLKLLNVVCGFGWQTFICKNYIQNICSVAYGTSQMTVVFLYDQLLILLISDCAKQNINLKDKIKYLL